jgi:hypothetical protein
VWDLAYIFGLGLSLQIRFDRLILLVELGQIRDEIFDDVGVREWIHSRFLCGISGDPAYIHNASVTFDLPNASYSSSRSEWKIIEHRAQLRAAMLHR